MLGEVRTRASRSFSKGKLAVGGVILLVGTVIVFILMSSIKLTPIVHWFNRCVERDETISANLPECDPSLIAEYCKLGIRFTVAGFWGSEELFETGFLGFKIKTYDLAAVRFSFRELFVDQSYLFRSDRSDPLIIDCGSNIGISILFFKWLYPDAQVIGFEPSGSTFELLKQNIESNGLQGVSLHQVALSNTEGSARFYSDSGAGLTASLLPGRAGQNSEVVKTDRLSNYIDGEVDFLKLDIEGAEKVVFQDLKVSGKLRRVKQMVVEYHHHLDPRIDALSEFLEILESRDFGYQILSPGSQGPFQGAV